MNRIDELLSEFPHVTTDSLIPVLQRIQDEFGFLSEDAVARVGSYMKLPASKIYGLATFYNQFRFIPKGKYHFTLCNGSGCHLGGSRELLRSLNKYLGIAEGETSRDGLFSLEVLSCIGACGKAPVFAVNGFFYPSADEKTVRQVVENCRADEL